MVNNLGNYKGKEVEGKTFREKKGPRRYRVDRCYDSLSRKGPIPCIEVTFVDSNNQPIKERVKIGKWERRRHLNDLEVEIAKE